MAKLIKSTKEIKVPEKTYNQVIGQDHALEIVKKAARKRMLELFPHLKKFGAVVAGDPPEKRAAPKATKVETLRRIITPFIKLSSTL